MRATKETMEDADRCTCGHTWGKHTYTGWCRACDCGCYLMDVADKECRLRQVTNKHDTSCPKCYPENQE